MLVLVFNPSRSLYAHSQDWTPGMQGSGLGIRACLRFTWRDCGTHHWASAPAFLTQLVWSGAKNVHS